ncbi:Protein of unknown function, partial [Gryllus bimaculatus]
MMVGPVSKFPNNPGGPQSQSLQLAQVPAMDLDALYGDYNLEEQDFYAASPMKSVRFPRK